MEIQIERFKCDRGHEWTISEPADMNRPVSFGLGQIQVLNLCPLCLSPALEYSLSSIGRVTRTVETKEIEP